MYKNDPNRTVIIAAMDRTPASDAVLYTATSLARGIAGAQLHFVNVVTPPAQAGIPAGSPAALLEEARSYVDEITAGAGEHFTGRVAGHLAVGDPSREILQLAADLEADLIVVGSQGKKTLERMLVGSVSQAITKKARCAVLVARPKEYATADVPEIEPPCPRCLDVQRKTQGERLWCEAHSKRHAHGHLHYEAPPSFGIGSMLLRPNG